MCANIRSELVSGPFSRNPCLVIVSACDRVICSSIRSGSASTSYTSSRSSSAGTSLQPIVAVCKFKIPKDAPQPHIEHKTHTLATRRTIVRTARTCSAPNGCWTDRCSALGASAKDLDRAPEDRWPRPTRTWCRSMQSIRT